jgi:hypothetical protein
MKRPFKLPQYVVAVLAIAAVAAITSAQTPGASGTKDTAELLKTLDQLIEQNRQLINQNQQLMDQVQSLRQAVASTALRLGAPAAVPQNAVAPQTAAVENVPPAQNPVGQNAVESQNARRNWGTYTPNLGYKVANTEYGDMSISLYTYARYLNQRNLDPTYTDAFGNVKNVQQRQDFQLNKVQMKFLGWIMSEKFRYFLYAWTSNVSQGQGAQVVLAGNLNYTFNKYVTLSAGITSLPGTRSVEGNFPFWLGVDSRLIADEYFRPSYTSGIWARGQFADRLRYQAMVGNNLSTLGVSAAQLDNHFNTFASALVWNPTGEEFGLGFGDFEHHETVATRLAGHFTRSQETRQSQPGTDSIENTQLRLSDGSVIFTPNLFGQDISITDATYKMTNVDGGLKYRGFSLDGTYYWRWLGNFKGPNTGVLKGRFDHGFDAQTSMMLMPKTFQLYVGTSKIFGQYGDPWDFRTGLNFFPWKNKLIRWNNEVLYLHKSPVGYTAVPFAVGGRGFVYHSTLELAF